MNKNKSDSPQSSSIESLTYEEAFSQLGEIISSLEGGENTLEEGIRLFERGQELIKHCTNLLDQAELKVQIIQNGQLESFKPED